MTPTHNTAIGNHGWRILFLIIAATINLTGCTTIYHFNTPEYVPAFPKLVAPVNFRAALVVPEQTREFSYSFVHKRWAIGEALESHLLSGLQAAFSDALVAANGNIPAGIDRIVTCSLGNKTKLDVGYTWSDKTATIELECRVSDASRTALWDGTIVRTETFNAGMVGTMLRLTALASVFVKQVDVGSAEEMYDATITSGVNNSLILAVNEMMDKMIKEGSTKICPACTRNTDWSKTVRPLSPVPEEKDEFEQYIPKNRRTTGSTGGH